MEPSKIDLSCINNKWCIFRLYPLLQHKKKFQDNSENIWEPSNLLSWSSFASCGYRSLNMISLILRYSNAWTILFHNYSTGILDWTWSTYSIFICQICEVIINIFWAKMFRIATSLADSEIATQSWFISRNPI